MEHHYLIFYFYHSKRIFLKGEYTEIHVCFIYSSNICLLSFLQLNASLTVCSTIFFYVRQVSLEKVINSLFKVFLRFRSLFIILFTNETERFNGFSAILPSWHIYFLTLKPFWNISKKFASCLNAHWEFFF